MSPSHSRRTPTRRHESGTAPAWLVLVQVAASLAAAMGIGRFVYTPILPLMVEQTGLTASGSALLATMNYLGYLIGSAAAIALTRMANSRLIFRASLVVMALTLAAMPLAESMVLWSTLRFIAGIASAGVFIYAVAALAHGLGPLRAHLSGWGMGGVGAGIALSGALVLVLRASTTWEVTWYVAGAIAAVLGALAWNLESHETRPAATATPDGSTRSHWPFAVLLASYTLEGIGYIIAGTFLVAAIDETSPSWVGSSSWIMVGIAIIPSTIMWSVLSRRSRRITLLPIALAAQLIGILLPVLSSSTAASLAAAALFGGTFVGIVMLSMGISDELGYARGVAILTTGYSVGQIAGPLIVAPLLHGSGYSAALAVGVGIVAASLALALLLAYHLRHVSPR